MFNKKNILILLKGGLISQVLPFLAYPIITRLYSAEDFGYYNTILSIITTITVFAILKLDQALPISSVEERKKLLRFAFYFCAILSLIIFIILIAFSIVSNGEENITFLSAFVISLCVLFNGLINLLLALNITNGKSWVNSNNQIIRAFILTFFQLIYGIIGFLEVGLLIAFVIAQSISLLFLIYRNRNELADFSKFRELYNDFLLIKNYYRDFPTFLTLTSVINTLGVTLPVVIITSTYGLVYSGRSEERRVG